MKFGVAGGSILLAGKALGAGSEASPVAGVEAGSASFPVIEHDDFPYPVNADYKQFNPEFNEFIQTYHRNMAKYGAEEPYVEIDRTQPGFRPFETSLNYAPWSVKIRNTGYSMYCQPNQGEYGWGFKPQGEPYPFESPQQASDVIKRAARLYGADMVGITRQDWRWDFAVHHDFITGENLTWEDDFPFKPKTVIVLAFEMDYESLSAGPTQVSSAATSVGYARMQHTAGMVAEFLRGIGYNAVASGNDLGLSVPYAIAAGLGESSRMGLLVTYKYGPRVRLAKVYTDLDLVEYDKAKTFGVRSFCERCQRCSDACPSKALSRAEKPSFEPPEGGFQYFHNPGIEKWYSDARKCREYWIESGSDCATCITSCPYNKPDFWQHRMIEKMNSIMPGPVHTFMREMDIWFGFGDTFDSKAPDKFWSREGRMYDGRA
ncbi:reductive dehalogenase [Parendozoicomonas haliclonae]|uniref:reductive dehalogenase n=1 Tax=Parendozoicomonas haliclonae TaxID=1960125 RepID=UPI0013FE0A7A|nr:reductive dehalogenase [Parendozoicomonas haliclonae]